MAEKGKIVVELIKIRRITEMIFVIFLIWFVLWIMTNILVT